MPTIGLLLRSLSRYEPAQLCNYVLRRVTRPSPDLRPAPELRQRTGRFVPGIARPHSVSAQSVFRLLNVEHEIRSPDDWNSANIDKLWLFTLHYHEWLSAEGAHTVDQSKIIRRWITENPPAFGVGWDAYPLSLRITQWIKWLARGEARVDGMLDSLAHQVRYLSGRLETHLGANHLLANAVALTAAGLFFAGKEPERWLNSGLEILASELPKQFGSDGGHYELSPSYHALILESLLDLENLANAFGIAGPPPWSSIVPRAREWLVVMTRPDGTFPQFNDCAQGVAPPTAKIEAYAEAIGLGPTVLPELPLIDLSDSGYLRLRRGNLDAFVDAGPFAPRTQPGHGHCDMLSFEVSVSGRSVIVNGGTSTYERSARRAIERSTASHNTVQVGSAEQSEIWSAFRAGRTASIVDRTVDADCISASHDGYRSLGIVHKRTFCLHGSGLDVRDELIGGAVSAPSLARIHLAPGIVPQVGPDAIQSGPLSITMRGARMIRVGDYLHAPQFNLRLPAKVLEIEFADRLETHFCAT